MSATETQHERTMRAFDYLRQWVDGGSPWGSCMSDRIKSWPCGDCLWCRSAVFLHGQQWVDEHAKAAREELLSHVLTREDIARRAKQRRGDSSRTHQQFKEERLMGEKSVEKR